ncbi:CBS domain-containing protein [Maridesulfovibrio ferrireducens]|uniref:CBS domain-containing protein n=1 Tax=Maridesulfovibrio ferrireducens TaxID=246191 RepID=A0A1G9AVL0_9BACT|nr:CBS domain-containing protein [Maridesulfovibrio ferrireducens]MBI9109741.1 CBS domain-containing protein [Maridesulfovibrio ferrireducens]SDK31311.1 CBS domain-containing protein [Maridesulfovibrio ferrireducens]
MLLRKRAWDMMREDFATIDESASLAETIRLLRDSMKTAPDNNIVVVKTKKGSLRGVASIWTMLKAVEDKVLKDEDLRLNEDTDWDRAFKRAGTACCHSTLDDHIETDIPILKPTDPMLVVLEIFRKKHRSWALVQEGGSIIGVVLISDVYRELTRDLVTQF